MAKRVLVTCPQLQRDIGSFRKLFDAHDIDVELPKVVQQLDEEQLGDLIGPFDGIIVGDDPLTGRVLSRANRLKVISKWGVGIDNIDLDEAAAHGIKVFNTPAMFADEVADVVVGYIVMLSRQLHRVDALVRRDEWPKPVGFSLAGKTLGIIGLGAIGSALANRAIVMGLRVMGHDISEVQLESAAAVGVEVTTVDALVRKADILSLNCPLTPDTYHLINDERLRSAASGLYIVNTARGALIEETALCDALASGRVAGAALDVFEKEPLPSDSQLRRFPQCILGSHNASNTFEASKKVSTAAVNNLLDGLAGA